MNLTTYKNQKLPSLQEANSFLSRYATMLLECGATCIRIEKNINRIAHTFQLNISMVIMPSYIQFVIEDATHTHSYSSIIRTSKAAINFQVNTQLSKLSWDIADQKVNYQQAKKRLSIIRETSYENFPKTLILVSLANSSFCLLFNGDIISAFIVFLATFAGFILRRIMIEEHLDIRLVFFSSAFLSSVIASSGYLFDLGNTPDIALGTSVLYLIPGVPYINSISDLLYGHYICAFYRLVNAVILTFCMSTGLCGGLLAMQINLF